MADAQQPLDPAPKKSVLLADAVPAQDEDLFIVAGLEASAEDDLGGPDTDLVSLLAVGPPEMVNATAELSEADAQQVEALARGEDVEIELGAAQGEVAAVLPPSSEPFEQPAEDIAEEAESAVVVPIEGRRAIQPWMAASLAAALVLAVGSGSLLYFRPAAPQLQPEVASVPVPPPVATEVRPTPSTTIDAACEPILAQSVSIQPSRSAMPMVAEPVEWVEAPPLAAADLPAPASAAPFAQQPTEASPAPEPPDPSGALAAGIVPLPTKVVIEPAPSAGAKLQNAEVVLRLKNGNFFGGKLTRLSDSDARLRFERGEIDFPMHEVESIVPLAQGPKSDGPEAILVLENGNRIAGRLMEERNEDVSLSMGTARLRVPRRMVREIEMRPAAGLILESAQAKAEK
ncbi:MAG: hypothetical protein JNJ88_11425 [Planctomycetes bacterium]|nr:hypothetical protein [Planctomycetota bacterium]